MVTRTRIAVAALVRADQILLAHRHPSREHYPDCWDLVGGHVEPGESPRQAVGRECLEELGVRLHDPRQIPMTIADPTLEMHAFLVTRWDGEPVNRAPEEHDDLRWFRRGELADLTMAHAGCLASALHALELTAAEPGWGAVRPPGQVSTRTVGDVPQA